jgi:MFS family permease
MKKENDPESIPFMLKCDVEDVLNKIEDNTSSCWNRFRQSRELVLVVVTIAIALDMMLYSAVLPILPAMLANMVKQCQRSTASVAGRNTTANRTFTSQPDDNDMTPEELTKRFVDRHQITPVIGHHQTQLSRHEPCPVNTRNTTGSETITQGNSNTDNATYIAISQSLDNNMDNCTYGLTIQHQVGLAAAAKPAAEIFSNVIAGYLVDRHDGKVIMVAGFVFSFAVNLAFAFAQNFEVLISARIGQAVTSSMAIVAGFTLIASTFPKGNERSQAMTVVYSGISIGPLVGYPFGILYEVAGQQAPFLILAALSLVDGLLRVMIKSPTKAEYFEDRNRASCSMKEFLEILKDPYLASLNFCSFISDTCIGITTSSSTIWVIKNFAATQWQIGVILSITQIAQLLSLKVGATLGQIYGQWKVLFLSLWVIAIALLTYPFSRTIWETLGPHCLFRLGLGLFMSVATPMISDITDLRHESRYGPVFGLKSACFNLGLTGGALLGGYIQLGVLYRIAGLTCILASFSAFAVRNPHAGKG